MEPSLLSLLPPLVTIACAIATRRILISLALGIVLGALLYTQGNVLVAGAFVFDVAAGLVIDDGAVAEEVYILGVVLLLGVLTSFIYVSGGLVAFASWAITKVRTRVQAQLVPVVLGIVIFFDDAFSSLVGGNVSRSITDQHRISRAKLSYLVDSTAAPVIILVPISGWAAFIAATMTGILDANGVTGISGYEAFLQSIPMNLYAITALLLAVAAAVLSLAFGPMRRHERLAVEDGVLFDSSRGPVPGEADRNLQARGDGRVGDLLWPVLVFTGVTVACALWIGIAGTDGPLSPMEVLANTDVIFSLFVGVVVACVLSAATLLRRRTPGALVGRAAVSGLRSMLMAAAVLFLAWVTAGVISELGIGEYLAGLIDAALPLAVLPVLLFALASFISFSIGSTFGTFGLLLPIAAEIALALDPGLLVPVFGAVLAGAIFGDHTSPLSDTTILSSIGSGIHLVDHVTTQLPFALVAAGASAVGYLALGVTGSGAAGLLVAVVVLAVAVGVLWARSPRVTARPGERSGS
ncbi:Na+/H+ antiporter NhaC family protein [Pseudonocardia kunmingensis]|uniref:Sodium/proton antiporter (NhaC family) n=1 Tax=Pseudonocardia kunmingensis TaxID=630975 RepID=A0A543DI34_9PSEU|nr:Na+/H+ antiporter NhaC family protein [Pseudonocardia kunmingensis]TQM08990.1 sodium/proton antiporter (NhaC family) [Pseudonocardia kunmingensis]